MAMAYRVNVWDPEAKLEWQGTYQDFPVNWLTGYLGVKEPKDSTITMDQIEYILVSAC